MIQRFEKFTTGITRIYKSIRKIKKYKMSALGLKGTHVMCLHYLSRHPEGLTATALCQLCSEDKAGISRILADLKQKNLIRYEQEENRKKYRTKAVLTKDGLDESRKLTKLILRAVEAGGKGLAQKDLDTFYRALSVIADNLEHACLELDCSQQKGNYTS